MNKNCVADIEGEWIDSNFESSLIINCKKYWYTSISELKDDILAMFLRQKIALELTIPEAKKRISRGIVDNSELFDGELEAALKNVL